MAADSSSPLRDSAARVHDLHRRHFLEYARGGEREGRARSWLDSGTVDAWRHARMYDTLLPVLDAWPDARWLTVGDGRFGNDARFLQSQGASALPTDISDTLLKEAKEQGWIETYAQENAEQLSFADDEFDLVFCKESLHHLPRPYLALHEALRVARRAIVLIEPVDPMLPTTVQGMLFLRLRKMLGSVLRRESFAHRFEDFGNYVYNTSRHELEKFALGANLGTVAFKDIDDYYEEGVEDQDATSDSRLLRKVKRRIQFLTLLTRLGLKPPGLMTAVIFKQPLDDSVRHKLCAAGYDLVDLPPNPHLG